MPRTTEQLRNDALAIWRAGVAGVQPQRLIPAALRVEGDVLSIGNERLPLSGVGRIVVVGGGKAGASMAAAVEAALGEKVCRDKQLAGWVNVPADCLPSPADGPFAPRFIHLHAGREAGVNEPRPEGVHGSAEILRLVGSLTPRDLCLCLLGGGGSALLPSPVDGVTLADKLALTRWLSSRGANIRQLNTVRKHLSRIKGGGLARACRAGRLVALIISDVIGDPLDVIASGPTVPDDTTAADALAVLEHFGAVEANVAPGAIAYLHRAAAAAPSHAPTCQVTNLVIGNLATAVDAAGAEAVRLGYATRLRCAAQLEGPAEEVGRDLADEALKLQCAAAGPDCVISGGEPVVVLVEPQQRGLGGRNQQLTLAAAERFLSAGAAETGTADGVKNTAAYLLLSGGTDGEDGPTDAAGAWIDAPALAQSQRLTLDAADHLRRNDAYHYFAPLGCLLLTGPTHTNVGDLRIVLIDRPPPAP